MFDTLFQTSQRLHYEFLKTSQSRQDISESVKNQDFG